MEGTVQFSTVPSPRFSSWFDSKTKSIQKEVNKCSKHVTQTQQQRSESPTITLTWHSCKYKVHKLHLRYILWWRLCITYSNSHLACVQIQGTEHVPLVEVMYLDSKTDYPVQVKSVGSWILPSHQPHKVTSGQIKHLKFFHASSKPKSLRKKASSQFWTPRSQQQKEPRKNTSHLYFYISFFL